MPFDGFDVENEPERRRDLEAFGIQRVPATIVGDRVVHGWNPKALAELVGVRHVERKQLSPAELARRLDEVLAATQRAIRQVPPEHLGMKKPGRDRTVHQLGFHVFRLSVAYVDTREQGHLAADVFEEMAPAGMTDGEAVAVYGETVRRRLAEYMARPDWCEGDVSTYYGPQTAHDFHGAHDLARGSAPAPDLLVPRGDARAGGRAADRRRSRGASRSHRSLVVGLRARLRT